MNVVSVDVVDDCDCDRRHAGVADDVDVFVLAGGRWMPCENGKATMTFLFWRCAAGIAAS